MAVPTIVGVGAKGSGTGNVQYAIPSGYQANDIGLLYIETNQNTTISVNQGWTQVSSSPQTATTTRLHLWWKRLDSSETNPTATQGGTTNHQCGGIIVLRGCITSGDPWNITNGSVETTSDTSVAVPGGTTSVNDCLVLAACCNGTDSNTAQGTGTPANPDLTNVAFTALNYNTTAGGGGGVSVVKGERITAGTYQETTFSLVTASDKGLINIALNPPQSQTISNAGNIDTGFVAGVAKLILTIAAAGAIISGEAFGSAKLNQNLNPAGIVSAETFGNVIVSTPQTISNAGDIASSETFGTAILNLNLVPSGIASTESFGTTKLGQNILTSGIATTEIFGNSQLNLNLIPAGIISAENFGTTKLNQNLKPSGILSAEVFGNPIVSLASEPQTIYPEGIASSENFGTIKLNQNLSPSGIGTGEAFGNPIVSVSGGPQTISNAGNIDSIEAFGTTILNQNLSPSGILTIETFGMTQLNQNLLLSSFGSGETFGQPFLILFDSQKSGKWAGIWGHCFRGVNHGN